MKSRLTRDILQSRQSDNQLADLGSINEYLAQRKRIVIDKLMALLEDWLENNPAFARHAQEGSASSSQDAASEEGVKRSSASHSAGGRPRQKRALQANGTNGSDSNGDENVYEYGEGKYAQGCYKDTLEFSEYVREELPQRVRSELEDRCNEFDNRIRTAFVSIVQSILGDMTKQFKEQHKVPAASKEGSTKSAARDSEPPVIEGTSSSSSSSASCPNPANYFEYDYFQLLSQGSSLSFPMDDGGDMNFDCRLSPNPEFHSDLLDADNLEDSAYVSLEGSAGSPASCKGY
ncbi:hypothetical protein SLS62_001671 [Diatrype stigma]|uniref:Uncharacterized protein n=1 Tax=Diatrype stigma TaxID=117547 RepID=A0AAN9V1N9_9PEZI